jgi:hypothetical protein
MENSKGVERNIYYNTTRLYQCELLIHPKCILSDQTNGWIKNTNRTAQHDPATRPITFSFVLLIEQVRSSRGVTWDVQRLWQWRRCPGLHILLQHLLWTLAYEVWQGRLHTELLDAVHKSYPAKCIYCIIAIAVYFIKSCLYFVVHCISLQGQTATGRTQRLTNDNLINQSWADQTNAWKIEKKKFSSWTAQYDPAARPITFLLLIDHVRSWPGFYLRRRRLWQRRRPIN